MLRPVHFTGSKPSLLLAGRCVLGCWAVGCSRACDVWGGGVGVGAGRLGRAHRALRLCTLGWAAVAVNSVALIWKFAWIDFLTIREMMGKESQFSAQRMSSRLSMRDEILYSRDETGSEMPAFLRKKAEEGKGRSR